VLAARRTGPREAVASDALVPEAVVGETVACSEQAAR
jgi:hypothetical protein